MSDGMAGVCVMSDGMAGVCVCLMVWQVCVCDV